MLSEGTRQRVEKILSDNEVVLFMKGSPAQPQCGFSQRASAILNELGVTYASVDVLADPEIREGIKVYGNWPTIPQLYVKKELIGGSDIMMEMYENGELRTLFS
jgi:monothiol glutaredoxin